MRQHPTPWVNTYGSSTRSVASWNSLWEVRNTPWKQKVWTQSTGSRVSLKLFVSNGVADIQRRSDPAVWWHIPQEQNPTDDAARGLDLESLFTESRWYQGSAFLHGWETPWPLKSRFLLSDCSEEGKHELAKIYLTSKCKQSLPLFDIERFRPGAVEKNGTIC